MTNTNSLTFFSSCVPFPDIDSNHHLIETHSFLEASKGLIKFVDLLGKTFIPVRNDINENIEKLNAIYITDIEKYKYIHDIVRIESETLSPKTLHVGTDALIWLTRALHYNQIFLTLFLHDFEEKKKTESLSNHFHQAYEESLKRFHNWFVQQIVNLCLLAAPSRSYLLTLLSNNGDSNTDHTQPLDETLIFNAIKEFLINLTANISEVHRLFSQYQVDYQ